MPQIVRSVLEQQLERSPLFKKLDARCRRKTGRSLVFIPKAAKTKATPIRVPLRAGVIEWGYLSVDPPPRIGRNDAVWRFLEEAAAEIEKWLHDPGTLKGGIIPGSITRATAFLRERFRDRITLAEVAAEVGLSRERLSRLFHESLGITFSQYLRAVRLKEACRLLKRSSAPIREIGFRCGYGSISQFNRAFLSVHGCSPRQFRNQNS